MTECLTSASPVTILKSDLGYKYVDPARTTTPALAALLLKGSVSAFCGTQKAIKYLKLEELDMEGSSYFLISFVIFLGLITDILPVCHKELIAIIT